jgi:ketosteroid isomerase-like protein
MSKSTHHNVYLAPLPVTVWIIHLLYKHSKTETSTMEAIRHKLVVKTTPEKVYNAVTTQVLHSARTTAPIVAGNHFVVGREKDITVRPHGRIQINQVMLYEVRDGKIVLEQFFY